ncbi:conserved hypothetical protein [Aspergillus terreus NIH2624]|uniref:Actin binding protein n=1 Tax=Aspergillus terreus (strain NIH 2624 / FGSC A1156) TaxID=341663 RepID=Q0C7D3_ASPTN|nr:uncharacterized protein ATEG_10401 [Aspergillus terreus NIH2624]EAU29398.1 conserved hypothetical protein [Aspergillus terreus NIH2624]
MSTLNLSSNGPSISKSYQTVVNSPPPSNNAAGSSTYGHWAVFSVSTPLVNAFQRDTGNKESILKVQSSGEGELVDLIDEFSEGKIQFAFVKVTCPNTGLPKNVLIAWCGEGVPERTKGYFTSHLAAVSKLLHGYHVQITARADGDLTPEGIIQKVGDASGSKYSPGSAPQAPSAPKPPVSSKPVFTPSRAASGAPSNVASTLPVRNIPKPAAEDDGWGPDAPPVTRTGLEKVQPAYKPTKVNIQELRSGQSSATRNAGPAAEEQPGVVKGGYQPVGKVDIAAIRRQAREAGELKDERPEPVKGAYEPVGKVDIAAIRARAQNPEQSAPVSKPSPSPAADIPAPAPPSGEVRSADRVSIPLDSGRLTSLPKPKVANKFGGGQAFTGTKPPLPSEPMGKPTASAVPVAGASRTFADEGGKTPAQIWAEKKARERGEAPSTPTGTSTAPIQNQLSGRSEWKSSYTGKTWAPVQTTHTGKSIGSNTSQPPANTLDDKPEPESQAPPASVSAIRDQLMREQPQNPEPVPQRPADIPTGGHTIPLPGLPTAAADPEPVEPEAHQVAPSPPPQPRSPTPPTPPVRETSPIRVAMPVGRTVTDAHDEQHSPPPVIPAESLSEAVPKEQDLEDETHDVARATAEATAGHTHPGEGIQALVQFDYEKAEDNEIDLREGEYVTNIEMVDKDWWLGFNVRGEKGLFPSNYVELVETAPEHPSTNTHSAPEPAPPTEPTPAAPGAADEPSAVALYDYEAAEDNELSFPENAEITNITFPDDDWWYGEYNGRKGLFPANYVELRK